MKSLWSAVKFHLSAALRQFGSCLGDQVTTERVVETRRDGFDAYGPLVSHGQYSVCVSVPGAIRAFTERGEGFVPATKRGETIVVTETKGKR